MVACSWDLCRYGTTGGIVAALDWVRSNHVLPAVVTMSLGLDGISVVMEESTAALVAAGVTVVVSAGNEARDACYASPSREPTVLTVASTTESDAASWFSNYGSCVDLFAPGSDVLSAGISSDSSTAYMSGALVLLSPTRKCSFADLSQAAWQVSFTRSV